MQKLDKLSAGDKVAIVSPSFAAPAVFPEVHEFGLSRIREEFKLEPVEYPTTRKRGASAAERSADLIAAFSDPQIKAVITTIGGDDQVTYVKNLPSAPFVDNPKPFFGYSDNTHLLNFLWLNGVPGYMGGCVFTEYARHGAMDGLTIEYLRHAIFGGGEVELRASPEFNDIDIDWTDLEKLKTRRPYQPSAGWHWDGEGSSNGITWGGCVESVDEILRHGVPMPTLEQFEQVVLMLETSEEIPTADYVRRVVRALGERGILERVQGVLVGRPKAWNLDRQTPDEEKDIYKKLQREMIVSTVRQYAERIPIVQNMDFGHTAPQICMPYGGRVTIDAGERRITAEF